MSWSQDEQTAGAVALLSALSEVEMSFRKFGHALYMQHQSVRWRKTSIITRGGGDTPFVSIGSHFDLNDKDGLWAEIGVDVWADEKGFRIGAGAEVEDLEVNARSLRELDVIVTTSLDECLATLRRYTAELCSYTTMLDELGIPRTPNR